MRLKIINLFIMAILISFSVSAIRIVNTEIPADDFDVYGSNIAYESEGDIRFHDLNTEKSKFVAKGFRPSVYGFIIAFHSFEEDINKDINFDNDFDDPVIRFYDMKEEKLYTTDFIGSNPSVNGKKIAFDVFEKDVDVDLNEDKDIKDHVIHVYDIETEKISNTKIVGKKPSLGLNFVVFETDESEFGADLNGDSRKSDNVIRLIFLEDLSVINTGIIGEDPLIYKDDYVVFTSDEALIEEDIDGNKDFDDLFPVMLKLPDLEKIDFPIAGAQPSIFKDKIVFIKDNYLAGFSISDNAWTYDEIFASSPILFEDKSVFLTNEKLTGDLNDDGDTKDSVLRVVFYEDLDQDDYLDLYDNCPEVENSLKDVDFDGLGDACDPHNLFLIDDNYSDSDNNQKIEAEEDPDKEVLEKLSGVDVSEKEESDSGFFVFFLIILLILAVIIGILFLPSYLEKRRKGFGF